MVPLQKCCCGVSLKKGSLIICYIVLFEEAFTFFSLLLDSSDGNSKSILTKNETKATKYFHTWTVFFNIIVVCTGLYGIYKKKAPLLIPYMAYRTVNLIFMSFALINAKSIADLVQQDLKILNHENEAINILPLIVVVVIVVLGLEFYMLLVVYSYYQTLLQNMNMIAVALPIVAYTPNLHDNFNIFTQPSTNPYLLQSKDPSNYVPPPQPPPPSYASSHLPPPYKP